MGILKDGGYLPDPQAIWKCPSDTEYGRSGPLSMSPYTDYFDPFETSYCGSFEHHGAGWPSPPWSFPPEGGHEMERHFNAEVYSPGNVICLYDGPGFPCTNGSNATDNFRVGRIAWPATLPFTDSVHRHGIDLPNMLFCDGHARPTYVLDIRDPENWSIEGWNKP